MRKYDETTDAQREGFAKAVEAGVRIAFGTDSGDVPARDERARSSRTMVKLGMTPMRGDPVGDRRRRGAPRLARTGWARSSPGAFADLIAVEGDPLDRIVGLLTDVAVVMKGGEVLKGR